MGPVDSSLSSDELHNDNHDFPVDPSTTNFSGENHEWNDPGSNTLNWSDPTVDSNTVNWSDPTVDSNTVSWSNPFSSSSNPFSSSSIFLEKPNVVSLRRGTMRG